MTKNALVIDYKYCTGCHTCEVACKKEKGLAEGEWGIKLSEQGPKKIQGKWMWNYLPVPSLACDLCEDRVAEGKKPNCVHHCLAECMYLVPLDEVPAKVRELGDTVSVFIQ